MNVHSILKCCFDPSTATMCPFSGVGSNNIGRGDYAVILAVKDRFIDISSQISRRIALDSSL